MMHCRYLDSTWNGSQSSFLTPTLIGRRCPFPVICSPKVTLPSSKNAQFWPISAYNISTVRDSEKTWITANVKSTMGFPTSYGWIAYVTPKSPKVWLKNRFFRFFNKSQLQSNKVCYEVSLCETSSGNIVAQPFPYLTVPGYWREK